MWVLLIVLAGTIQQPINFATKNHCEHARQFYIQKWVDLERPNLKSNPDARRQYAESVSACLPLGNMN